jgi:hypothetical protein
MQLLLALIDGRAILIYVKSNCAGSVQPQNAILEPDMRGTGLISRSLA